MLPTPNRALVLICVLLVLLTACRGREDGGNQGSGGNGGSVPGNSGGTGGTGGSGANTPDPKPPTTATNQAHFERPAKAFAGSVDFVDGMIQASAAKEHRIYVDRYHGSAGQVSVQYRSHGDAHTPVEGELVWEDGESGRKSFTVTTLTANKGGEHRVWLDLSSSPASGGVRLGRESYSRMYIITDNGSEAETAVWVDSQAGNDSNNGSKARPLRTVSAAIEQADVDDASHVYLKSGVYKISDEPIISIRQQHGILLTERSNEAKRLTIRSAPGQQAVIDGVDNSNYDRLGFYAATPTSSLPDSGGDYVTLSHLHIRRVVNGIWHHYSQAKYALVYNNLLTEMDGIAGSNVSGIALWGVESATAFNNTVRQIRVASKINGNGVCIQSYRGKNLFLQQNTLSDCYYGIYHKQSAQKDGQQFTSMIARRNYIFDVTAYGFNMGIQGGFSPGHSYSLITQNVAEGFGVVMQVDSGGETPLGHHNEISHNIFDRRAVPSDQAALHVRNYRHIAFFANIILERDSSRFFYRNLWSAKEQTLPSDNVLFDLTDYNIVVDAELRPLYFAKAQYGNTVDWQAASSWGIELNSLHLKRYPFVCEPEASCETNWHLNKQDSESQNLGLNHFAPGDLAAGPFLIGNERIGSSL